MDSREWSWNVRNCEKSRFSVSLNLTSSFQKGLITSAKQNKVLNVYVTECRTPMQNFGREMASRIVKSTGFSVQMVVDSSVARIMQEVDIVVFGAEVRKSDKSRLALNSFVCLGRR